MRAILDGEPQHLRWMAEVAEAHAEKLLLEKVGTFWGVASRQLSLKASLTRTKSGISVRAQPMET